MSQYEFKKYKRNSESGIAELVKPINLDTDWIEAVLAGEFLARDLINTPANDLGLQSWKDLQKNWPRVQCKN